MLSLLVLACALCLCAGAEERRARACGTCDPARCAPLPADGCAPGTLLRDACGCCKLCGARAGEPCGARSNNFTRCAPGLECVRASGGKKKNPSGAGACTCKSNYQVCGSDLITYPTACELRAASARAEEQSKAPITVLSKGKCAQAPVIMTPPGEVWNVTGSQVYLSCEAIGIPTPVVTWRKVSANKEKQLLLPDDRENMAIQNRGGPEKHEVTSWVLISPLTKQEAGKYECHASNAKGEASAVGTIHVVDSISDIPSKKALKDDEL